MNVLKQAKLAGLAATLAVLVGCAGQVNEEQAVAVESKTATTEQKTEAAKPSKVESAAEKAAREARQAEFEASRKSVRTAEQLKNKALAADTLFFFGYDKSDLSKKALDHLDAHANYLSSDRTAKVRLEGHADERGTRAYNLALGERRANAVARYLVIQGVNRSQIETVSYGEERPLSLARNDSGWSRNRRVELIYQ